MPMIDFPLETLLTYQGRNPRPADHDRYWSDALAEMNAVDPQIELIPVDFNCPYAECFDLYFTGTKGARVYAQYLRPKAVTEPHPAILMFHGYRGSSGDLFDKLPYVAAGMSVAALDARGQGGRSQDIGGIHGNTADGQITRGIDEGPHSLLFRDVFLDTALLAKIVMAMPEVDAARVGAMGISQGGGLTLACASLVPSLKRIAPVYPFLSDYRRVWEMDLAQDAYADLRLYLRRFDPLHEREEEIFTRLGYIDIQYLVPRIKAEVLFYTGLMDSTCPPSTQFAAYNKITAPKHLKIYPDFAHEALPQRADSSFEFMMKL